MFLSKEETETPPIGRIRPIAMYTPLRKGTEAGVAHLDDQVLWNTIDPCQWGARPEAHMWKPTANLIKDMNSK